MLKKIKKMALETKNKELLKKLLHKQRLYLQ